MISLAPQGSGDFEFSQVSQYENEDEKLFDDFFPPGSQYPDWEQLHQDTQQEDQPKDGLEVEGSPQTNPQGFVTVDSPPNVPARAALLPESNPQTPIRLNEEDFPTDHDGIWNYLVSYEGGSDTKQDNKEVQPSNTENQDNRKSNPVSVSSTISHKRQPSNLPPVVDLFGTSKKRGRPSKTKTSSRKARKKEPLARTVSIEPDQDQTKITFHFSSPKKKDKTAQEHNGSSTKTDKRQLWAGKSYWAPKRKHLEGYIFPVTDTRQNGTKLLHAVCGQGACLLLSHSFIGDTEAKELCSSDEWKSRFSRFSRFSGGPEMDRMLVRCLRKNMFEMKNEIPVRFLDEKQKVLRYYPNPFLVYDSGATQNQMNKEYRVAYMHQDMLKPQLWRTMKQLPKKPRALDLCAGCGGMTIGFHQAGFDSNSYLVEKDPMAAATLRSNYRDAEVYEECVRMFLENCQQGLPGYPKSADIDHVHGSFPCQGFSQANRKTNKKETMTSNEHTNNELSLQFISAIQFFRPRTASFENVRGMLRGHLCHYMQRIGANLLRLGYHYRIFVVKASKFGDPQNRHRVILFAAPFECYLPDEPKPDENNVTSIHDRLKSLCGIPPTVTGRVELADKTIVTQHTICDKKMKKTTAERWKII